MSKHTPGPWEAVEQKPAVVGPDFELICDTFGQKCRDNARAIAALPDLLEAANKALHALTRNDSTECKAIAIAALRTAVAKAGGSNG
jgi:hypothetical protein